MKKLLLAVFTSFSFTFSLNAQTLYASPTSTNSTGTGTDINNPVTLARAIALIPSSATTACTVYLRGGTYTLTAAISLASSRSGTAANIKNLLAYPGDARPVLDFSSMTRATTTVNGARGVSFSPSYWCIKGIDFFNAADNGIFMSGSYNKIENCAFYENQDTGLQLGTGASNNQIINCDSYYNVDPGQGNADGFAVKLDVGTGNSFTGCRAWQNSDDGWDGYMRPSDDINTTLNNCWAFKNGYLKSGAIATSGNGNGFKMGGSDAKDKSHNFTVTNCLAFQNKVRGFDQNNNKGSMILYNCTSWNNGQNYGMNSSGVTLAAGKVMILKNCISLTTASSNVFNSAAQFATNSWTSGFSVSAADFQSLDPTAAYEPRQADGSLPDMAFMKLATTSSLIDKGTDVGLPFSGSAPDLGAFESSVAVPVTLTSFSATNKGSENILNWTTATELNNASFIIERSSNGIDFQSIGEVKGHGTTATPQYYTFTDKSPLWGLGVNYYRLRQMDFDEKATLSKTVSVTNASDKTNTLKLYPSVTCHLLTIDVQTESPATLYITDSMGCTVLTQSLKNTGFTNKSLDVSAFSNGIYMLTIVSKSGQMTEKFVKN